MILLSLLITPIIGVLAILLNKDNYISLTTIRFIGLITSIVNLFISLVVFIFFDFSTNQFQFVQEYHEISYFDLYLGIDGLSIYFVLLTTIIAPISLLSNWISISEDVRSYVIIILLLETLLLTVFLVLDILLFYIFFESILPPLFILIGVFGSDNRITASFYLFLYTLLGSLFLLLSILAMLSVMSTTDFDALFKGNFLYITQLFLFYGIFIAFAVKTPTIFLNTWLLKAHVESPLGGSIILAAIVLKLSLYGIFRLILPILPKAYMEYTYIIFFIGVITIAYASLSTLRTTDVKELIAYSSVSHAAVYLLGVFSNSIQGIEGGITLGLAHGLVSPGLFICAGGILYDRSHTRLISLYRGMAQIMPLFAVLFFILCLANCGAPLTLNFIGEFLSLYGVFERSSLYGLFASSSIVFSAAYTIYMYQKISFGGAYSSMFTINFPDLTKREFTVILTLVIPTVIFGIYPAFILDGIHYSSSTLLYCFDIHSISCDAPTGLENYSKDDVISDEAILLFLLVPQLFSDYLRMLKDKLVPGLEWALHNPPKPHAFTSLPLQSSGPWSKGSGLPGGSGEGSRVQEDITGRIADQTQLGEPFRTPQDSNAQAHNEEMMRQFMDGTGQQPIPQEPVSQEPDSDADNNPNSPSVASTNSFDADSAADRNEGTRDNINDYKEDLATLRGLKGVVRRHEDGTETDQDREEWRRAADNDRLDKISPEVKREDLREEIADVKQQIRDNIGNLEYHHHGDDVSDGGDSNDGFMLPFLAFPTMSLLITVYKIWSHPIYKLYLCINKDKILGK